MVISSSYMDTNTLNQYKYSRTQCDIKDTHYSHYCSSFPADQSQNSYRNMRECRTTVFVLKRTRTKLPLEFDILVVSTRKHQALSIVLFDHETLLEIFITENFIVISANSTPLLAFILISF